MEQEVNQEKVPFYKKKKFQYTVIIVFGVYILGSLAGDSSTPTPVPSQPVQQVQTTPAQSTTKVQTAAAANHPTESKADAQKELDELMALSKKAGLVTSYEFSDSAAVVYADSVWYTQTVAFKKDFLAKIGTLKKIITGYMHFEVRDAYSAEWMPRVNNILELEKDGSIKGKEGTFVPSCPIVLRDQGSNLGHPP